jgi:hypothetical protein
MNGAAFVLDREGHPGAVVQAATGISGDWDPGRQQSIHHLLRSLGAAASRVLDRVEARIESTEIVNRLQGVERSSGSPRLDGEHRRAVGHEQDRWSGAHA